MMLINEYIKTFRVLTVATLIFRSAKIYLIWFDQIKFDYSDMRLIGMQSMAWVMCTTPQQQKQQQKRIQYKH